MSWGKRRIAGQEYDLGHLDPFTFEVTPKGDGAPTYTVRVSFGHHTFTRALTPNDKPDLHFKCGGEMRCFCTERYELSEGLPDLIRYAANGRVYFSERPDFMAIESLSEQNAPYVAFFKIEKAKKGEGSGLLMFVTSAHLRPALPDKLPAVTFVTLASHTFSGAKLKRPEPRKIVPIKRR